MLNRRLTRDKQQKKHAFTSVTIASSDTDESESFEEARDTISLRKKNWNYALMAQDLRKAFVKNAPVDIKVIYQSAEELWQSLEDTKKLLTEAKLHNHPLFIHLDKLCSFAKNQYAMMFRNNIYQHHATWKKIANRGRKFIAACLDFFADEIIAAEFTLPELTLLADRLKKTATLFLPDENERQNKHKQIAGIIEMMLEDEQTILLANQITAICLDTTRLKTTLSDCIKHLKTFDLSDSKESADYQQLHQLKFVAAALLEFAESDPALNQPRQYEEDRLVQANTDRTVAAACLSCFIDEMKDIATSPLLRKKLSEQEFESQLQIWQNYAEKFLVDTTIKKQIKDQLPLLISITRDPDAPAESKEEKAITLLNSDGSPNEENFKLYRQKLVKKFFSHDEERVVDSPVPASKLEKK